MCPSAWTQKKASLLRQVFFESSKKWFYLSQKWHIWPKYHFSLICTKIYADQTILKGRGGREWEKWNLWSSRKHSQCGRGEQKLSKFKRNKISFFSLLTRAGTRQFKENGVRFENGSKIFFLVKAFERS